MPASVSSVDEYVKSIRISDVPVVSDADAESNMLDFYSALIDRAQIRNFISFAKLNDGICLGQSDLLSLDIIETTMTRNSIENMVDILVAVLSVAGIEVALPNIRTNNDELILEIRNRNNDERMEYQHYLRELVYDGYFLISDGAGISEIKNWAHFVANTKIKSSLDKLETAIRSRSDRKLLQRIGLGLAEKAPTFFASKGVIGTSTTLLSEIGLEMISILAPNLFKTIIEKTEIKQNIGIGYLYNIRKLTKP